MGEIIDTDLTTVRAKFICQRLENQKYQGGETTKVVLTAATAYNSPADKPFWDATPSGTIELQTINQFAVKNFVPGQAYFIDFIPAPTS